MGQVFLAMSTGPAGVQKLVVVKQLRDDLASSPIARDMFLDEARLAALLQHPNIVQTFDVVDEGDDLYIVMEYLDGRSLARTIEGDHPASLSLSMRLHILADVLGALHYAHERLDYEGNPLGVVHRDVSPQNIFLTYDGHVKLLDFGIAKAANATAHTATGMFKGKVRHAAPEQALGMNVDRRADVYAVGTVLWESLTGQKMWKEMGEATILFALASGKIPSVRETLREIPEELEAICCKALARDPIERYATASDFRHAILDYLHSIGDVATEQDLAGALHDAFGERRREMQARIESQIRLARESMATSAPPPSLPRLSTDSLVIPTPLTPGLSLRTPNTPGSSPRISSTGPIHAPQTAMSDAPIAPPSAAPPSRPAKRRGGWLAATVTAAIALGAVAIIRVPAPPDVTVVTAAASPAHIAAEEMATRRVHMSLRADPPGARFFLDGVQLRSNPYEADVPGDDLAHALTIRADGFDPRALPVKLTSDVNVVVALTPLAARSTAATTATFAPPRRYAQPPAAAAPHPAAPAPKEAVPQKPNRAIDEDDPYTDNPYGAH
jgi:serine/threonine-protein kinase